MNRRMQSMLNPNRPPAATSNRADGQLPLRPITAREMYGVWMLIVVLPTMITIGLIAAF